VADARAAIESGALLADAVDETRRRALRNAGFHVWDHRIPAQFTEMNRIILGRPPAAVDEVASEASPVSAGESPDPLDRPSTGRAPPSFRVPVADAPAAIDFCARASGKAAAARRKAPPPPCMDVAFWLPAGEPAAVSAAAVERLVGGVGHRLVPEGDLWRPVVRAREFDVFVHSGRESRAFRIEYFLRCSGHDSTGEKAMPRDLAIEIHSEFQRCLGNEIPGAELRG
jgi:hypothetical protein